MDCPQSTDPARMVSKFWVFVSLKDVYIFNELGDESFYAGLVVVRLRQIRLMSWLASLDFDQWTR